MTDRLRPLVDAKGSGRLVPFGPAGDRMPARITGSVTYPDRGIRVHVECSFDGARRPSADRVTVERTDGQSVSPEDVARIRLANVMRQVTNQPGILRADGPIDGWEREGGGPPDAEDLRILARLYWIDYVTWLPNPREGVMHRFQVPRSTANSWIRKARALHPLPGPHHGEES